jgi:hypothetical protein
MVLIIKVITHLNAENSTTKFKGIWIMNDNHPLVYPSGFVTVVSATYFWYAFEIYCI